MNNQLGEITGAPQLDLINVDAPEETLGNFITWILDIAFGVGILIVLAMLIWGAYQFMTSGGNKQKLSDARNRMIWSVVGLIVLAASWAITSAIAGILNPGGAGILQLGN